jgi:hypothetical protein
MISPGRSTGIPGGYANTGSAQILLEDKVKAMLSRGLLTASLKFSPVSGLGK